MDEYIEKGAAITAIMSEPPDAHYPHWYADKIKSIPAADVEPVRHGRWIPAVHVGDCCYRCSECQFLRDAYLIDIGNYCPNCGAKMDLE